MLLLLLLVLLLGLKAKQSRLLLGLICSAKQS